MCVCVEGQVYVKEGQEAVRTVGLGAGVLGGGVFGCWGAGDLFVRYDMEGGRWGVVGRLVLVGFEWYILASVTCWERYRYGYECTSIVSDFLESCV